MTARSNGVRRGAWALLCLSGCLAGLVPASGPSAYQLDDSLGSLKWQAGPALPEAVSNNAVAGLRSGGRDYVFSFLGLGSGKDHRAVLRRAYRLDVTRGEWTRIDDVPGAAGRLAATAQALAGRVYLFGGYTVAPDGQEASLPNVDVYDVGSGRYRAGAPMPVPVDDAVSGLWRSRLIFLVSGWSDTDNVRDVQIYDPSGDAWRQATPIPAMPVFGHAGAVVGDVIVYCGGALVRPGESPRFAASETCLRGDIDAADPRRIAWSEIAPFPGEARYRMAAAPFDVRSVRGVLFVAGTANPYNYDGIGYDGRPSAPAAAAWVYDVDTGSWRSGPTLPAPSMDHRALARAGDGWFLVGGMVAEQRVTPRVHRLALPSENGGAGRAAAARRVLWPGLPPV